MQDRHFDAARLRVPIEPVHRRAGCCARSPGWTVGRQGAQASRLPEIIAAADLRARPVGHADIAWASEVNGAKSTACSLAGPQAARAWPAGGVVALQQPCRD